MAELFPRKQIAYPEIYAKKTLRTGIVPGDKFRIQIPVFRIQLPAFRIQLPVFRTQLPVFRIPQYRYSGSSYRHSGSSHRYSGSNHRYSGSISRYFGSSFPADLSDERRVGVGRPHVLAPVELPVLVDVSVQVRLMVGAVAAPPATGGGGGGGGVPGG
jgi:hypothetical protein